MTKKDFEAMATRFGNLLANLNEYDKAEQYWGVTLAVSAFADEAERINPRFDRVRFGDWVLDVAYGRRDVAGRKVKVSA